MTPGSSTHLPLSARRAAAAYLLLQGVLTAGWWVLLLLAPAARELFKPQAAPDYLLLAFWLADLVCIAAGSGLSGLWLWRGDRRLPAALWFTSGAITYAALYCVALTAMTREALLGVVLMVPAAFITIIIAMRAAAR